MGLFAIKKHFNIDYIVQKEKDVIFIGTEYVHDLIRIKPDGTIIGNRAFDVGTKPGELTDLFNRLQSESTLVYNLFHENDVFEKVYPVYTYQDGRVVKKYCPEYGWPNTTTDGELMYENTFFQNRSAAKASAKKEVTYLVAHYIEMAGMDIKKAARSVWGLLRHLFNVVYCYVTP